MVKENKKVVVPEEAAEEVIEEEAVEAVQEVRQEQRFVLIEIPDTFKTVVKDNLTGKLYEKDYFAIAMANKINSDVIKF